jgi:histone H2A
VNRLFRSSPQVLELAGNAARDNKNRIVMRQI